MIGTKISDGTENDLSKEAKSAIPTSIYMTLQEIMTEEKCSPRSSFSYQQHKRLEKKNQPVSYLSLQNCRFYFVVVSLKHLSLYPRISFLLLSLTQTSSLTSLLMAWEINADYSSTIRKTGTNISCIAFSSSVPANKRAFQMRTLMHIQEGREKLRLNCS